MVHSGVQYQISIFASNKGIRRLILAYSIVFGLGRRRQVERKNYLDIMTITVILTYCGMLFCFFWAFYRHSDRIIGMPYFA